MSNDINSSTITCNSTHLTSFAVLVDVSDGHQVGTYNNPIAMVICDYHCENLMFMFLYSFIQINIKLLTI